jgi:SMODS and SLOG-associating 2TM effector domain 3/SMODS and SLOG-associating 2TM effector domain 1
MIKEEDLPALYNAADKASNTAQKRYIRLFRLNLLLLVFGAVLTAVSFQSDSLKAIFAMLAGSLFVASLLVAAAIGFKRYEKTWYGGRAIAESVKTLAWKYMTGAEPYESPLTPREADEQFAHDLSAVLEQRKHLSGALQGDLSNSPQITDKMRSIRGLKTEERKAIYVTQRIEDQRRWYTEKATTNQTNEWRWFILILTAQVLAAASAFIPVWWPSLRVRLTGVFATLAAGSIAWLQVKRHQELAQSYNLAAQELALIAINARHVTTEEELSRFVSNAESAVSREHTMWVARRDQT